MKEYLDDGKFAAPRWLVYPQLSYRTIGWSFGYGERYAINEPWHTEEFKKLFPEPKNWIFAPRFLKCDFTPLGIFWSEDGTPKYCEITDNCQIVNDFITLTQEGEFQCSSYIFNSIEHAILLTKYYTAFFKCSKDEKIDILRSGFDLTDDEQKEWEKFEYSVCLNALYYKVIQDNALKEKLLSTGDKTLVYISDDKWGGKENLFGFALMDVRDEINRLYENEDLIDWQYTEYLKAKDPFEQPIERNPKDKQSEEYIKMENIFRLSKYYIRDVDLDENMAGKYEIGQIIYEKTFVDASDKIGGMITTHRYIILSNRINKLDEKDEWVNWGLNTVNPGSKFIVLDIYTFEGKTLILLLHIVGDDEELLKKGRDIEKELIRDVRKDFEKNLSLKPIPELTTDEWLERCSFPIGMSDEGEFFEVKK